jgi:acyl-CoA synthetase (AMP-forming)/AMP-acid ligase II
MDIGSLVAHHARYRGMHTGVIFEDQRLTWAQFHERTLRLARAMQDSGIAQGDRVATVLGNHLELLDVYWACAALGAVAVPLSPLLMKDGLASLLADAAPRAVFVSTGTASATVAALTELGASLPQAVTVVCVEGSAAGCIGYDTFTAVPPAPTLPPQIAGDALYNIMYTSGTTGLPKGIMLTHQIRALYGSLFASAWRMTPESVALHTGAIVFNGSFLTLLPAFTLGATYILHRQFDAAGFIETVAREKVTHTFMVPAQIAAVLNSPQFDAQKLASLQMLGSVGAPLPLAQKEQLEAQLPGRFHELYGLTEGFMTILDKQDALRKRGSVGCPMPFTELRVVGEDGRELPPGEVGEIIGRGPLLMPGYYQRPDLTAAAIRGGWLYSGDLGHFDADGFLFLVDRKKDMIDSGGVKVYPRDIEEVIARHPDVLEAVVFGIPDDKWGETPAAAVRLKVGAGATADELKAWINERVAARYQRVSLIDILDELPRNAAGKILKRELREPYWKNRATRI